MPGSVRGHGLAAANRYPLPDRGLFPSPGPGSEPPGAVLWGSWWPLSGPRTASFDAAGGARASVRGMGIMPVLHACDSVDPNVPRSCLSNDSLHLILLPTEACNFRCVYCYEDFRGR